MITFRHADETELDRILGWAADEGWNPGLDDATAFFAADPRGFFVAIEDEIPVASISVVNHNDDFAFLGLYIVHPNNRGKGIGYALWQHAIKHAGDRTIGLDGVPAQQSNYAASGFTRGGSTKRFSGSVAAEARSDIRDASTSEIPKLVDQEAIISGVRKAAYLTAWFTNTEHRKTLIDNQGFCTVRKCREGAKVGPLLAHDVSAATRLVRHAASVFAGDLILDVPESSGELVRLCGRFELEPGFETTRMYLGEHPVKTTSLFAMASLELG